MNDPSVAAEEAPYEDRELDIMRGWSHADWATLLTTPNTHEKIARRLLATLDATRSRPAGEGLRLMTHDNPHDNGTCAACNHQPALQARLASSTTTEAGEELDALLAEQSEDDRLDAASSLAIDRLETRRGYVAEDGKFVPDPIGAYVQWETVRAAVRPGDVATPDAPAREDV